jgi:phage baseplate assembly protein W
MAEPIRAFRFPLAYDAGLRRIAEERDYEAYIVQLMKQVLLTNPGERINRPDFGAGLRALVFAPTNEATATLLQTTVFQSLDRWLGTLISVENVAVDFSPGRADVVVQYTIRARGTKRVLNLEVIA